MTYFLLCCVAMLAGGLIVVVRQLDKVHKVMVEQAHHLYLLNRINGIYTQRFNAIEKRMNEYDDERRRVLARNVQALPIRDGSKFQQHPPRESDKD